MSVLPEGEWPGGEEPFEGIPPEDLESRPEAGDELPDLEPEFVDALREAAGDSAEAGEEVGQVAEEQPPAEEEQAPAHEEQAPAADRDDDQPAAEQENTQTPEGVAAEETPAPGPADTVEFTPEQVSDAQQAQQDEGDEKPRRTVVIGAGPAAPPTEVSPVASGPPPAAPSTEVSPIASGPPPAAPSVPGKVFKPPPQGDSEPPPKRKRLWLRFLIASLLIIAAVAGATSASTLIYAQGILDRLKGIPGVRRQLLPTVGGAPENILILGSDKRAGVAGQGRGRSDTAILLRLDPNRHAIALMSIPRDLKIDLPGYGIQKFNAAYTFGGPALTVRMVKTITGLSINHVVNVDFLGFARAVDAIGCVYIDVDRRYFHSNAGLVGAQTYDQINIQPGYQRLCGDNALHYVRYRHTDTDLVREARQQDFLREARQQISPTQLFFTERDKLLKIFTTYTTSDIKDLSTLIQVLKLFVASRGAPIEEVHFPAVLHPSFVTASPAAIHGAVEKFLGIQPSGGPRGSLNLPQSSGQTGIVPQEKKRARAAKKASQGAHAPPTPSAANDGLIDASQGSRNVAAEAAANTLTSFPVFYPRRLPPGSIYVQQPRVYHLMDTSGHRISAYATIAQIPSGDYFGVQGLHGWTDPPILKEPSETRMIAGRQFDIFLDGNRIRLVSWRQGNNTYWIYNSLLQTLTNDQMLGMARSIGMLPGQVQAQHKKRR